MFGLVFFFFFCGLSEIVLRSRKIATGVKLQRRDLTQNGFYVFHLSDDVTTNKKNEILQRLGIETEINYIHKNAYLAYFLTQEDVEEVHELSDTFDYFLESDKTLLPLQTNNIHSLDVTVQVHGIVEEDDFIHWLNGLKGVSDIKKKRTNHFSLHINADNRDDSLNTLIQHEHVVLVIPSLKAEILNYGLGNVMGGAGSDKYVNFLKERGLNGENQIVGISDSGIQTSNCFFHDENYSGELPTNSIIEGHRKLVYIGTTELGDSNGHGTHTSGTLAGKSLETEAAKYNGIASESKIFLKSYQDKIDFQGAFDRGVRVHSNSWGLTVPFTCSMDPSPCTCTFNQPVDTYQKGDPVTSMYCFDAHEENDCCRIIGKYEEESIALDSFLYNNDEYLAVFAAGNSGKWDTEKTVVSPCVAKNSLCVGSSRNTNTHWQENSIFTDQYKDYVYYGWTPVSENIDECCDSTYKTDCCPAFQRIYVYEASPRFYGETVLSEFSAKGPTYDGRIKPEIIAPGENVVSARSNYYINIDYDGNMDLFNQNDDSYYCGTDEVTFNQQDSAIEAMYGTSQSTPGVAGLAVLVRQYLLEGFYPSQNKTEKNVMSNPSGTLLKAILVNGAEHTLEDVRISSTWVTKNNWDFIGIEEDIASNFDGFGLVGDFGKLLFDPNSNLILRDRIEVATGDKIKLQCLKVFDALYDVAATLTYYDPPGSLLAGKQLINQVNLIAELESCNETMCTTLKEYSGNIMASNVFLYDDTNPTEKIIFNKNDESMIGNNVCFYILGTDVSEQTPQKVSVAINYRSGLSVKCGNFYQHEEEVCGGAESGRCVSDGSCVCYTHEIEGSCYKKPSDDDEDDDQGVGVIAKVSVLLTVLLLLIT